MWGPWRIMAWSGERDTVESLFEGREELAEVQVLQRRKDVLCADGLALGLLADVVGGRCEVAYEHLERFCTSSSHLLGPNVDAQERKLDQGCVTTTFSDLGAFREG